MVEEVVQTSVREVQQLVNESSSIRAGVTRRLPSYKVSLYNSVEEGTPYT